MKIFYRLFIILIALSSTHRAIPAAAAAAAAAKESGAVSRSTPAATPGDGGASGGGSSSSAAAHGGAGARAAYAGPASSERRVATSEIVRAMFDHPYTCFVTTIDHFSPDELSPLECALRITGLDFDNREIVDEMVATIRRNIVMGAGGFFTYLNALLAAVDYNGNSLLKAAMQETVPAKASVPSLLISRFRALPSSEPVQACVMNSLEKTSVILGPDDDIDNTTQLHGHEFCFPFSEESPESALMRIRCLGKYITFLPFNLREIGEHPAVLKGMAGRVLQQILVILGSLPASPQTFVYGKQLEQLVAKLKTLGNVNVDSPDIDQASAEKIVAVLSNQDSLPMTDDAIFRYLINTVQALRGTPEAIIDQLQLITQLSENTNFEFIAYAVFKKVALGFSFGLSQAQIVDVLIAGKLY